MLGILVVTHGNLAKEFVDVAFRILGESDPEVVPLCVEWTLEAPAAQDLIRRAVKKLQDSNQGVLILTDLFGGTPTNLAMTFYQPGKVEILTGLNLPMLIKAVLLRKGGTPIGESLSTLREKGQSAMVFVSEVLGAEGGDAP
jgi:PTS system mannose-specific IIA component